MATLINEGRVKKGYRYFRWHDSGDIQGIWHLRNIADVCRRTPKVRHWLPTKEHKLVSRFLRTDSLPGNLVIRVSGHYPDTDFKTELPRGTVHTDESIFPGAHICQAVKNNRPCGACRKCWDPKASHVSYQVH